MLGATNTTNRKQPRTLTQKFSVRLHGKRLDNMALSSVFFACL